MATWDSCTVEDIKRFAFTKSNRKKYPFAFDHVADPDAYKFELRRFQTNSAAVQEEELLHIAFLDSDTLNVRVWAHSDGNQVQYFRERPGQPLETMGPPFPDEGSLLMNNL